MHTVAGLYRSNRPWGHFDVLAWGADYCIKTLVVAPGMRLSLQRHRLRSERWQVLQGCAHALRSDIEHVLPPGSCLDIEPGQWHRLENRGTELLIVLEAQHGRCLEDDIERADDDFGRCQRRSVRSPT